MDQEANTERHSLPRINIYYFALCSHVVVVVVGGLEKLSKHFFFKFFPNVHKSTARLNQ